ncbi:hypothetical protein [Acidithiobacillus sp.]
MTSMNERIQDIAALTERLKTKYPAEINSFLGFMGKAESGPALMYPTPLASALDEFLPEEAHG